MINELWKRSLKGQEAAQFLRHLLDTSENDAPIQPPTVKRRLSVVRAKSTE
jgi:hypothetical protein